MTIVVATDCEKTPSKPVAQAFDLAQTYGTDLVVLHVMPQDVFDEFRESMGSSDGPLVGSGGVTYGTGGASGRPSGESRYTVEDGQRNAAKQAREVLEGTLSNDADVVVQGRVGEPTAEIIAEADRRDASYLVIGGRKRSPAGKALFGSTTQSILLNSTLPIVTVM